MISVRDRGQKLSVRRVGENQFWEISVAGHVRSVVPELRFVNAKSYQNDFIADGTSYVVCSSDDDIRRGIFKVRTVENKCRSLVPDDLVIQFAAGFEPTAQALTGTLPSLDNASWQKTSEFVPQYLFTGSIDISFCSALPAHTIDGPGYFVKTAAGEWLIHHPQVQLDDNTATNPLSDGGVSSWQASETGYCSNVRRTFLNEDNCKMATVTACVAGSDNITNAATGVVVCGSPGEVANDPSLGDFWLDVSSISGFRSSKIGLPRDTTQSKSYARQREFIWSEVVLTADDQIRQRVAWALFQIFSLPKTSLRSEDVSTEFFLQYYDIFVRNAFGNYFDILREITYSPLMAESLSFLNSRSTGNINRYKTTKIEVFPDENFARELQQLFTIGLVELNMDGTPVLDATGSTIQTYDSEDIMSFARAWTGFVLQEERANVESGISNQLDPLRINAKTRDRFPKSDLEEGYIGDFYPLCADLPSKSFLRIGAKYRLLGSSPLPELLLEDDKTWALLAETKRFKLETGSGLYDRLCAPFGGSCTFPSVVVLDINLACASTECTVDTVRVIQVDDVFYEYIRVPCVEHSFFENARKVATRARWVNPMCANPKEAVASEACCAPDQKERGATHVCAYAGERTTLATAESRCAAIGQALCNFRNLAVDALCPHRSSYHWTSESCNLSVKVRSDGQVALVHDIGSLTGQPERSVRNNTISYFPVYWNTGQDYPTPGNACGGGSGTCQELDGHCLCGVTVADTQVFLSPPETAAEILSKLRVGHAGPNIYDGSDFVSTQVNGFVYHSSDGTCCDQNSVFEVIDRNGMTQYLRNVKSVVTVTGTAYSFRNPPQFNSVIPEEYSVADAQQETDAVLQYLFHHKNTPPFVSTRLIQRFGISNPGPRYVLAVATAFRDGIYQNNGVTFGNGKYGDMAATTAAILLDREARSLVMDDDPSYGSLREPILKVIAFMRAMEFKSSVPLVQLDLMDEKIGQMAYEQASVFSFFRPEYSPPGPTSTATLAAPEAEIMSSGKVIGLLNGLFGLVKLGLRECASGFGAYGDCKATSSGDLSYMPADLSDMTGIVRDLSTLLTSGRLGEEKQSIIASASLREPDPNEAFQLALQLLITTPEFHTTNKVGEPTTTVSGPGQNTGSPQQGYKAVIHLTLKGGNDSFNVLVPGSSCPLRQEYNSERGEIALPDTKLLPLAGDLSGQPCTSFALHNGLPHLKTLYDAGDLLFAANVGVLTEPVTKENYKLKTVTQLFSHNSMQNEIQKLDPTNTAVGTGALGRTADALESKGFKTGRVAVEATPTNLAGGTSSSSPIVTIDQEGVTEFGGSMTVSEVIEDLNGGGNTNGMFGDAWSSILGQALNQTEDLFDLLVNTPTQNPNFSRSKLGKRFKLIAQLIAGRNERGVERDFFFVSFSGFDTHADVSEKQRGLFRELNDGLEDLTDELKAIGVWDDVVIVQTSDFGRTLTPNTGDGTDHGWGGHYFMAGGSVKGNRIVGEYPSSLTESGPFNVGRGRIIPSTPWDSIFNGVANWLGVTESDKLDDALPNRGRFSSLFGAGDLFN